MILVIVQAIFSGLAALKAATQIPSLLGESYYAMLLVSQEANMDAQFFVYVQLKKCVMESILIF